jgi:hypothetical protein
MGVASLESTNWVWVPRWFCWWTVLFELYWRLHSWPCDLNRHPVVLWPQTQYMLPIVSAVVVAKWACDVLLEGNWYVLRHDPIYLYAGPETVYSVVKNSFGLYTLHGCGPWLMASLLLLSTSINLDMLFNFFWQNHLVHKFFTIKICICTFTISFIISAPLKFVFYKIYHTNGFIIEAFCCPKIATRPRLLESNALPGKGFSMSRD